MSHLSFIHINRLQHTAKTALYKTGIITIRITPTSVPPCASLWKNRLQSLKFSKELESLCGFTLDDDDEDDDGDDDQANKE